MHVKRDHTNMVHTRVLTEMVNFLPFSKRLLKMLISRDKKEYTIFTAALLIYGVRWGNRFSQKSILSSSVLRVCFTKWAQHICKASRVVARLDIQYTISKVVQEAGVYSPVVRQSWLLLYVASEQDAPKTVWNLQQWRAPPFFFLLFLSYIPPHQMHWV